MLRACIVQGSQQIWVAALWYWGFQLQNAQLNSLAPWWIVLIVWPLAAISFLFSYLMLYGLPGKQFLSGVMIILGSHLAQSTTARLLQRYRVSSRRFSGGNLSFGSWHLRFSVITGFRG
jgi:hypothetical protein